MAVMSGAAQTPYTQYGETYPPQAATYSASAQYGYPQAAQPQYQQYNPGAGSYPAQEQEKEPMEQFMEYANEAWTVTKTVAAATYQGAQVAYRVGKDVTDVLIKVDEEHQVVKKVSEGVVVAGHYALEGAKFVATHAQRLDNEHGISIKAAEKAKELGGKFGEQVAQHTKKISCCSQKAVDSSLEEGRDAEINAVGVNSRGSL